MSHDADLAAEAFRRGASGFLLKTCAASELAIAVRDVLRGRSYLSPTIAKDTVDFLLRQDAKLIDEGDRLTDRQREVLQLLAEGKCMKEVAGVLNITTRTVAFHKYRMMEVLSGLLLGIDIPPHRSGSRFINSSSALRNQSLGIVAACFPLPGRLRSCRYRHRLSMVQRLIHLSTHPQPVEQHC